jgi:hypothetical protein
MNTNRDASSYTERMMARAVQIDRMNRQNSINKRLMKVKKPTGYNFSELIQVNSQTAFLPSPPFSSIQPPPTIPPSPRIISIVYNNSTNTINLEMPKNDSGSPVIEYILYSYSGESIINVYSTGISLSYNIPGLMKGMTYTFTAIARNSVGDSLESNKYILSIPPTMPNPPSISSAMPGNAKVTIALTVPTDDGGSPLLKYIIYSYSGETIIKTTVVDPSSSYDISGLINGISYKFTAVARNAVGDSLESVKVGPIIPATIPDRPTNVNITNVTNTSLSFTFDPPLNDGGKPITNYYYSLNFGALVAFSPPIISGPITINNIPQSTSYNIYLYAYNEIGIGQESIQVSFKLRPSAPTLIYSLSDINAVYIYITQQTSVDPILYYEYSLDNGSPYIALNPSDNISPIKISGLTNGLLYNISLRAVNIFGFGVSSDRIQAMATLSTQNIHPDLYYDPNDPNCYSGSGSYINNLVPDNITIIGTKGSSVGFYNDSSISRKVFDFSGNDGINNIILFGELELPYILTITAWIYPREKTINTMNTLFGNTKGAIGTSGLKFQYDNSGQIMRMDGASDISYKLHDSVSNIIKYNEWQHISYVFDKYNRKICMFWNGRPVDINITSDIITSNDINMLGNFSIGGCIDGSFNMNAKLGFIKIYSYNLNAGDIYVDYISSKSNFIK